MKKTTYYFSHDYNAANDVKILFLRQKYGMLGYGIYWYLVEQLAISGGQLPMDLVPVLAMQMHTEEDIVYNIIKNYTLFNIHEGSFSSDRLSKHLDMRKTLSEKGKQGATQRWNTTPNSHPIREGYAKERKGKENKGNEIEQVGKIRIKT